MGLVPFIDKMRPSRLVNSCLERLFNLLDGSEMARACMALYRKDWLWIDAHCTRRITGFMGLFVANPLSSRCKELVARLERDHGPLYQPPQQEPLITELPDSSGGAFASAGAAAAGGPGAGGVDMEGLDTDEVFPADDIDVVKEVESRLQSGVRTRVVQLCGEGDDRPPALVSRRTHAASKPPPQLTRRCPPTPPPLQAWRVRNYNSTAVEYTLKVTQAKNARFSAPKENTVVVLPGKSANNDLIRCIRVRTESRAVVQCHSVVTYMLPQHGTGLPHAPLQRRHPGACGSPVPFCGNMYKHTCYHRMVLDYRKPRRSHPRACVRRCVLKALGTHRRCLV